MTQERTAQRRIDFGQRGAQQMLVGVSRAITDFSYCTYLSDVAVDQTFQRRGIGRELIRRTHLAAGLNTNLILLAAPKAETYYLHIGCCRTIRAGESIASIEPDTRIARVAD